MTFQVRWLHRGPNPGVAKYQTAKKMNHGRRAAECKVWPPPDTDANGDGEPAERASASAACFTLDLLADMNMIGREPSKRIIRNGTGVKKAVNKERYLPKNSPGNRALSSCYIPLRRTS